MTKRETSWTIRYKNETLGGNPNDFRRKTLLELDENKPLHDLAMKYHMRCDAYDIELCGNPEGMPMNGYESGVISRHARRVLRELEEIQHEQGISGDLLSEIRRIAR